MNLCRATFLIAFTLLAVLAGGQQLQTLPNGLRATSNDTTLQITALRNDIVRVRMWKGSTAPEDASWAVLPASRTSSVAVNAAPGEFSTTQLRISIDP